MDTFLEAKRISSRTAVSKAAVIIGLCTAGIIAGAAIAQKPSIALLVVMLPLAFFVSRLSDRIKIRILVLSIILLPIQLAANATPRGFSISEMILVLLVTGELSKRRSPEVKGYRNFGTLFFLPFVLFAGAGFVSAIINGDVNQWHVVVLTPLLWVLLADRLVHTEDDVHDVLRAIIIALAIFLGLLLLANLSGHVVAQLGQDWRFGGQVIALGPIEYTNYAITLGSLLALGIPLLMVLIVKPSGTAVFRLIYLICFPLFLILLFLTAARGATIGALIGLIVVFILNKDRRVTVIVSIALLILVAWPLAANLLTLSGASPNLASFSELVTQGPSNIHNFTYRMDTLMFTINSMSAHPLGHGFGYLGSHYGIDESIIYSALLSGTGVVGFMAFALIIGQLLKGYLFSLGALSSQRELVAIGLATLVTGLIAGVSSESVLLSPMHSFMFWAILSVTYKGIYMKELTSNA